MINTREDNVVSKVGLQPDPLILEEMRRRHPNAMLAWNDRAERWALVDVTPGLPPVMIRLLTDRDGGYTHPTLANTVWVLDTLHPSNMVSEWDKERFLRELDENPERDGIQRRAREQARDGSSELYDVLKGKTTLVPNPKR